MIINWYGEGCFKVQTGGLTLITDPFDSSVGLNAARGKNEAILRTMVEWPAPEGSKEEQEILGPGEYEVKGIEVTGIAVPKESSDKLIKTIYTVKAEDMNLCFLGHLSSNPDAEILDELEKVDILFIPAGGKGFIDEEAAAKFIKQIDPKIVVMSFFKVPGLKRAGAGDVKDLAKELGHPLEMEEKLVIKKKDLTEGKVKMRVIALKI
ncbi:MAG: MBL fold metallo-hydrolase [Candidatus Pacebacteria bacterium]|nr:MBL fold metallo-hydrolase [Candidatus Paceibacterota bacterium]